MNELLPPPLGWLQPFTRLVQMALGYSVSFDVKPTINPLLFTVRLTFGEPLAGNVLMRVWNLLQIVAAKNESVPQGKVNTDGKSLIITIGVKRRLGPIREDIPQ